MQRFLNLMNGPGLNIFVGVLLVWAVVAPVTARGAALAARECPPADPATPNTLPPCKTTRTPMTPVECEAAIATWRLTGSLETAVIDSGVRKGYTIRLVCEGNSYSFTIPAPTVP